MTIAPGQTSGLEALERSLPSRISALMYVPDAFGEPDLHGELMKPRRGGQQVPLPDSRCPERAKAQIGTIDPRSTRPSQYAASLHQGGSTARNEQASRPTRCHVGQAFIARRHRVAVCSRRANEIVRARRELEFE